MHIFWNLLQQPLSDLKWPCFLRAEQEVALGSTDFFPEQLNFPSVWNADWASNSSPPNLTSVIGRAVELVIVPISDSSGGLLASQLHELLKRGEKRLHNNYRGVDLCRRQAHMYRNYRKWRKWERCCREWRESNGFSLFFRWFCLLEKTESCTFKSFAI